MAIFLKSRGPEGGGIFFALHFYCIFVLDFCPVIVVYVPWLLKMSRSGYFKDLGNFGQQILNQVASDIRSNAENLGVFSFGPQDQQRNNPDPRNLSEASTPSGTVPHQRTNSTSSSQATTPEEVAGEWLNNVSHF